jgi:hypothetical protein
MAARVLLICALGSSACIDFARYNHCHEHPQSCPADAVADACASPATRMFGKNAVGLNWESLGGDNKTVSRFVLYDPANVVSLSAYLQGSGTTGTEELKAVIYTDAAGIPDARAAVSQEMRVSGTDPAAWITFALPSPVSLAPGVYWLGENTGPSGGVVQQAGDPLATDAAWNRDTYADGPSDPFGASMSYGLERSIYATYGLPCPGD